MQIIEEKYNWRRACAKRYRTDYIVLHHAEAQSCTAQDIHRWHLNNGDNWNGIGYHFFVRKNGQIYRGRPIDTVGAHALNYNSVSVGVCSEGAYDTVDTVMPEAQRKSGQELVVYLRQLYPQAQVKAHRDLMATSCPGRYFPFYAIINDEKENENMEERKKEYEKLEARIVGLENPMIYNYIDQNMPEWARPLVLDAVARGIVRGDGDGLDLKDSDLKAIAFATRTVTSYLSEFETRMKQYIADALAGKDGE